MIILGIDTSSIVATCAIATEDRLIAELVVNNKKTHSQKLLPAIARMFEESDMSIESVDAIAVAKGPGSFTGLRIGVSTAKGLAFALQKPVVGINTLDALAYNVGLCEKLVCPLLNARRGQVYTALYQGDITKIRRLTEYMAVGLDEITGLIHTKGQPVIFLGDGAIVYKQEIKDALGDLSITSSSAFSMPRASSVAFLGIETLVRGEYQSAEDLEPFYLRRSQAEILWESKNEKTK